MNSKDITAFFYKIEDEYKLFDIKIDDIYFWKVIRLPLYNKIAKKTGVRGQAHSGNSLTKIGRLKALPGLLINTYIHGVGARRSKVDTLVFEHPRKLLIDGEYTDIYTAPVRNELIKNGASFESVDHPQLRKHFNKPSLNRSYMEHAYLLPFIHAYIKGLKISDDNRKLLDQLEERFNKEFNLKINITGLVENYLKKFKREESFYTKMLRRRGVKELYLVVSYGKEALISACSKAGVKSIELQHGTIYPFHLGYSFPYKGQIPYFPNELHLFGKFWEDSVSLPDIGCLKKITGYDYLETKLEEFKGLDRVKNSVLFISQGAIGEKFSQFAADFANNNSNMEVLYKLHPGEYDRWQSEYSCLVDAPNNLKVISDNKINLYHYLAEADYVIGVFSTVVYEALAMGCRTVLVDLPGVESLQYLIDNNIVKLTGGDNPALEDIIKEDDFKVTEKSYFFKERG